MAPQSIATSLFLEKRMGLLAEYAPTATAQALPSLRLNKNIPSPFRDIATWVPVLDFEH